MSDVALMITDYYAGKGKKGKEATVAEEDAADDVGTAAERIAKKARRAKERAEAEDTTDEPARVDGAKY